MNNNYQIVYPDYHHSNLGIMSAILQHYQVPISSVPNPILAQKIAEGNYRNIVFLLLDGMGTRIMDQTLSSDAFLQKHRVDEVTAVYPSTTACATASFFSGLQPVSHAWLGWALYFAEWDQCIDVLPYRDTFTNEPIDPAEKNILTFMDYESIFTQIHARQGNSLQQNCIFTHITRPRLINVAKPYLSLVPSFDALLQDMTAQCKEAGRHFIFGYWKSPDDLLHSEGLQGEHVQAFMTMANQRIADFADQFEDALVVITADHGMQDVNQRFALERYDHLCSLMRNVPGGDLRATSFYLKAGKEDLFANRFEREFGEEFLLWDQEKVIREGLLGVTSVHPRTRGFVGDFMALGVGRSEMLYSRPYSEYQEPFKGCHSGLTAAEMLTPLILFEGKR